MVRWYASAESRAAHRADREAPWGRGIHWPENKTGTARTVSTVCTVCTNCMRMNCENKKGWLFYYTLICSLIVGSFIFLKLPTFSSSPFPPVLSTSSHNLPTSYTFAFPFAHVYAYADANAYASCALCLLSCSTSRTPNPLMESPAMMTIGLRRPRPCHSKVPSLPLPSLLHSLPPSYPLTLPSLPCSLAFAL